MSDFLSELNKTATISDDIELRKKQEAVRLKQQQIERDRLQREKFENYLVNLLPQFKKICIDAVRDNCYVSYEGRRYIFCSLVLLQNCHYGKEYDTNTCSILFGCSKLVRNHIIPSKREYLSYGRFFELDYLNDSSAGQLSELGCSLQANSKNYDAPNYVALAIPKVIRGKMEGFTDNIALPKNVTEINRDPSYRNYSFTRIDGFTRAMYTYEFLIRF